MLRAPPVPSMSVPHDTPVMSDPRPAAEAGADERTPVLPDEPSAAAAASGRHRALARSSTLVFAFTLAASATNYLSNVILGRVLTPASFGDLTALLSLTVIVSIPAGAAQAIVAQRIARNRHDGADGEVAWAIRYSTGHIGVAALAVGLVYAMCIPLVESVLDLQAVGPAIALVPLIVLSFLLPLASGFLQGLERFIALGWVMLGVAIGRIAFGVPWALAGGGSGGAIAGQALATLFAVAAVGWMVRGYMQAAPGGTARGGARRRPDVTALVFSGAFFAFAMLSNLDVILAKVILDPHESGEYAALATIGKLVLFLPSAVAIVMVPSAARARREGAQAAVLRTAALLTGVAALVIAIPAAVAPETTLRLMFGDEYVGATDGVLPIVVAGAGLAVINLLVIYTVSMQDRRWPLLLIAGIAVQAAAIFAFGTSPATIATTQAAVVALLLLVNELLFHPLLRAERLLRRRSP
jgi:O-antigen/teichoic acid export membrane protein